MTDLGSPFRHAAPPRQRNLFAHIMDALGQRIVGGMYKPGEFLPKEDDLVRELRASRTVVREVVKALAAKGLLEIRTRTGTRVLLPTHWNLLDLDVLGWRYATMPRMQFLRELFELRLLIEAPAAGFAAQRASDADIAAIGAALEEMDRAEASGDGAIEADLAFHRAILEAAHNDLLVQMGGVIGVGLLTSFRISNRTFGVFLDAHRAVYDAIRARQPDKARAAMESMLGETRDFLERELAEPAAQPSRAAAG